MAASTADAFGGAPLRARLQGSLRRLGGVAAWRSPLALAVASGRLRLATIRRSTKRPRGRATNPPGRRRRIADLLVAAVRLRRLAPGAGPPELGPAPDLRPSRSTGRGCPCEPAAGAARLTASWLATCPDAGPELAVRVGLGGSVGDCMRNWLRARRSVPSSIEVAGAAALVRLAARLRRLGLRWARGDLGRRPGHGRLCWVGRHLGDAAGRRPCDAGRWSEPGWTRLELAPRLRRPGVGAAPGPLAAG